MLKYKLENAINDDINLIIKYKLNSITEYVNNLSKDKISNYVNNNIPKQINDYKVIKVDNKIIGCLLVTDHLDGILLDEIFIEEKYRNNGIGSDIIKGILSKNDNVYLWVYKRNINAYALYKKFGFYTIEETENRFFMKYSKLEKARKFCQGVRELANNYDYHFS